LNCNTSTTFFGDIRRLPAAHFLVVTAEDVRVERYWSAPIDGRIRYRREEEYAEHFAEVLRRAVADRFDVDRAAVFLSGGLDSGAVAASAREVAPSTELHAFTATCETLFEDRERHFARQTADMLGIPFQLVPFGDERPFADWEEISIPEPVANPLEASSRDHLRAAAEYARVALNGEGADNLMAFEFRPYAADLARRGEWLTLASASGGFFWKKRARLHRLGLRAIRKLRGGDEVVPDWIDSDFAKRMRLRDRLDSRRASVSRRHPILPVAHASLEIPDWASFLEALDPGFTGQMIEQRFPFIDLRVVEYLLAIPPYPHFLGKAITRRAMRGKLPAAILSRPKTPLRADPRVELLRKSGESYLQNIRWEGKIGRYVSSEMKQIGEKPDLHSGISCMHAVCLNFWLQSSWRLRYKFVVEVS
jgi:asparagine synthase (glutamine-hydrolysing)